MRMSTVSKNILTIAIAVLGLGAFLVLAEGVGGKSDAQKRLDALEAANTTTSMLVEDTTTTSTTTFVVDTTTSSTAPATVVTSAPATTPTTRRATTATTRRSGGGTATTAKRPKTTTTAAAPACPRANPPTNGATTEVSDNQSTFTLPGGSTSATPGPSATDPLSFLITATPKSGTTNNVTFKVTLQNHTSRTIRFPNGIKIRVKVTQDGSPDQTYDLSPQPPFTSMESCESDVFTATDATVLGSGTFTASATVDVDYGS